MNLLPITYRVTEVTSIICNPAVFQWQCSAALKKKKKNLNCEDVVQINLDEIMYCEIISGKYLDYVCPLCIQIIIKKYSKTSLIHK